MKAKHTKCEGPEILLPYQIRWLADESAVKVAEQSRRAGLTWTEAADSALRAAAHTAMDTWYIGCNRDMAREFIGTAAQWARQFNLPVRAIEEIAVDDETRDLAAYRLRISSGRQIVALSSRPSHLRGKQGRAVIDKAAFHEDLPGLMKAALAFTRGGGAVRVISTHHGTANPFNQLVNDIRAGRAPYSLHRVTIDDAIADGLYYRICRKSGKRWSGEGEAAWRAAQFEQYGELADEELLCIPRTSGRAIVPSAPLEARIAEGVPVVRWAMPAGFGARGSRGNPPIYSLINAE